MLGGMTRALLLLLLAAIPAREAPRIARETRLAGTVVVEALVDSTGAVAAAGIARSHPALDDAAVARVRAQRFEPLRSASGALVASLREVPVEFEGPPANGLADSWEEARCEEATFTLNVDVRPDSAGRFEARWQAKGLKSQELFVVVLTPDGAAVDTTGQGTPQQLDDDAGAPAWPAWHRTGREVKKGADGRFAFTLPETPWWRHGRVAVIALFRDGLGDRMVVRQKAWRVERDDMGPLLVRDPGPAACAAGPWRAR
jgi:TonB family protein